MAKRVKTDYLGWFDVVPNHDDETCVDVEITDRHRDRKVITLDGNTAYEIGRRLKIWLDDMIDCFKCGTASCATRLETFHTCMNVSGINQLVVIAALVGSDDPDDFNIALIVHWLSSAGISDSTSSMVIISQDDLNEYIKHLKGEE